MSLADYVRILGRGPGRARSYTQEEAETVIGLMLAEEAAPEAVGAILMLLRMKGETAAEIAGLAKGAQAGLPQLPKVDLDWPSYAAGRSRGLPWFLLSARLVALAGHRVLLHGWNGPDGSVRAGLADAGITETAEPAEALSTDGIAYVPLETFHPALYDLLALRPVLGLRSCINTVCRMLNPGRATASVQGVFHPSYRMLQADAAALLGWQALTVIKGGGGEFERMPTKAVTAFGLRDGAAYEAVHPPHVTGPVRLADGVAEGVTLAGLWAGAERDDFAEAVVIGTAALALGTLGHDAPRERAKELWDNRHHLAYEAA